MKSINAGLVLSPIGMEVWLDESDESTMIEQGNESTSSDTVLFWTSKTYNTNKLYLCVPKYILNIKSQPKLYLVNKGTDVQKYPNYETVSPIANWTTSWHQSKLFTYKFIQLIIMMM